jgi:DNA invertase Pin-like site-specific DNA recombinase
MKRAALDLRVSTLDQNTDNQERELREVAVRSGNEVTKIYRDHGISGAKGRDQRPAFDALCKDANRRRFDVIMAWSVDRLGRSLTNLLEFLKEVHIGSGITRMARRLLGPRFRARKRGRRPSL